MKRILLFCIFVCLGGLAPILAQQLPPAVVWKKCFGGSGEDKANFIIPAWDGGFIVAGSSKSNVGDVTGHHGSTDFSDAWIFKISSSGDLEWQKSFGGTNDDEFTQVIATADGNYLAIGSTNSNNGDVTGHHGSYDAWAVKIDRYGNLLWQTVIGGTNLDFGNSVKNTIDGGYVIVGSTSSNDGDISGNHGGSDVLLAILSSSGAIQSQFCYGGSLRDEGFDVEVLPNGDMLIGNGADSRDGDFPYTGGNPPISSVLHVNASGAIVANFPLGSQRSKVYGVKLAANGKLLVLENSLFCYPMTGTGAKISSLDLPGFVKEKEVIYRYCQGSAEYVTGYSVSSVGSIIPLPEDNMVLVGSTDDPTLGIPGNPDGYTQDAFMARSNWTSSDPWKKAYGGSKMDHFSGVAKESDFSWVVAGYTNSDDGDVIGNHGSYDCWIIKFGNFNIIKGTVFADHNLNGTKDPQEPYLNNIMVQSQKGAMLSSSPTLDRIFSNSVDTGTFTTKVLTTLPYYNLPASQTSIFSTYNQTDSISFALQPIPGKRDYKVDLFAVTPARPGFEVDYKLQYLNVGTDTLQNRTIRMVKDSRLQFISSSPAEASIVADTILWNISSLLPRDTGFISIHFTAAPPPDLNYGDTILHHIVLDTTGDLNPVNNISRHALIVTGAYDPNDKQEAKAGMLQPSAISNGEYLVYTIRFQNTGTDTAFNIVIMDTLSEKLDASSFEMISASHRFNLTVRNGNIFNWTFKNILLVDSNRNEPLSHGYITYRVKARNHLVLKDSIRNSASIYFDFNLPVKTNTQLTIVSIPPPPKPAISNIQAKYCGNAGAQKARILNLPESDSETSATAFLNNQAISIANDSTVAFDPSTLPAGNNTMKVIFQNPFGRETVEHDFQITAEAEPEVNLQSSTTHITSLTDPVILTANNTAGGGANPVFTFAKDRAFATVLQEGNSTTLHMNAANFSIGENWLFVRMKTSEICFKTETNIDSIKITRDITTGITDPDNPGQVIRLFPNPFKGQFQLNGLNSTKVYSIVINDAQGKLVFSKLVGRSNSIRIALPLHSKGIYLLTIYDYKKKQLIGTAQLVGN